MPSPMPSKEQQRDKARLRKQYAIEDARATQGAMQILWIHLLRRSGFNFVSAYYMANAITEQA